MSQDIKESGAANEHGLGVTLGLNRNSEKSLFGGYAGFNPSGKWTEYALNYAYKFDKNKLNKVSSTFFISPQYHYAYKRDFSNNDYDIGSKYLNDRWSFARTDFGHIYGNSIDSKDDKSYLDILLSYSFKVSRFNRTLENRHELSPTNDKLLYYNLPNVKVGYKVDKLEVLLDFFRCTEPYIDLGIIYKFGKK